MAPSPEVSVLDDDGIVSHDLPEDTLKQVIAGEWILKKNTKVSRAWELFRVGFDPSNDAKVLRFA